jgi:hypothetical protein
VLSCIHNPEPEGCGEALACERCGANGALRHGLPGRVEDDGPEFQVWNAGVIPDKSRLAMLNPPCSTKGAGRGVGTYPVELFAEEHPNGQVSFIPDELDGTTFTVMLPLALTSGQAPI